MLNGKTKLKAQQALELVSKEVEHLEFSELKMRSYSFDEVSNCDPNWSLKNWLEKSLAGDIKQPIIYKISVENDESAKLVKACFVQHHVDKARGFALARWNKKIELSHSLYVGSSRNIRQRLKQHLFDSQLSTYALHMGK